MSLITAKNISLSYDGINAVENLSFSVEHGDYLCIVGENGSGKSTLIKTLAGLKKPASGELTATHGGLGYLPQQTTAQRDFPASVREIVYSGLIKHSGLRPFFTKKEKQLADNYMQSLDILNLSKKCYGELSGGQQQRVLLARALCASEKLLLLDEPVSGLDPIATSQMYDIISHLNKEHGTTVIMVSHDISSAVKYASKILHINKQPLFFGKTEDYLLSDIGRAYTSGGDKNELV